MQEYSDYTRKVKFGNTPGVLYAFRCELTHGTWFLGDVCFVIDIVNIIQFIMACAIFLLQCVVQGTPLFYKVGRNVVKLVLTTQLLTSGFKVVFLFIVILNLSRHLIIILVIIEYFRTSAPAITVVKSVVDPIKVLVSSLILIMAFILLFSIIIFQFFHKDFFENHLVCQTLMTCFIECLNYGMRNGGGVGDSMFAYNYDFHPGDWAARAILDLLFFVIVNIILLNVVFGVIIDKFGEFRDEKMERMDDKDNVCYICGKDRPAISQYIDYDHHTTQQHYIRDYWYYILHLKKMDPREMNGLQHYVARYLALDTPSFDWFPIGRALAIESAQKEVRAEA